MKKDLNQILECLVVLVINNFTMNSFPLRNPMFNRAEVDAMEFLKGSPDVASSHYDLIEYLVYVLSVQRSENPHRLGNVDENILFSETLLKKNGSDLKIIEAYNAIQYLIRFNPSNASTFKDDLNDLDQTLISTEDMDAYFELLNNKV